MQDLERRFARKRLLLFAAAGRPRAEKKAQDMTIEVFAKAVTQQTREDVAENAGHSIVEIDKPGEMLDENGTGKTILAREGRRCEKLSRHADVGFVIKPKDLKCASAVFELRQEGLDGMNGMQELEAIFEIDTGALQTVCQQCFAVDTKEACTSKIANDVDGNGPQRRLALMSVGHFDVLVVGGIVKVALSV
jgi:hypothetical protein